VWGAAGANTLTAVLALACFRDRLYHRLFTSKQSLPVVFSYEAITAKLTSCFATGRAGGCGWSAPAPRCMGPLTVWLFYVVPFLVMFIFNVTLPVSLLLISSLSLAARKGSIVTNPCLCYWAGCECVQVAMTDAKSLTPLVP
jgi:hypothetical protein